MVPLVIVPALLALAYQDWKSRSVSLWLLGVLAAGIAVEGSIAVGFSFFFRNWLVNVAALSFQFLLLWLFFRLKEGRWVALPGRYVGWGDILFFIITGGAMSPLFFCWAYLGSLLFTLLGVAVVWLVRRQPAGQVPLILGTGLFFAMVFLLAWGRGVGLYGV